MARLLNEARIIARSNAPVLLTGETGTGKEILARLIHEWSGRRGRFVALNCAALCESLAESQLFGHRKGSFTGATEKHVGAARLLNLTHQGLAYILNGRHRELSNARRPARRRRKSLLRSTSK